MAFFKRFFLFALLNLLVVVTLSTLLSVLGVGRYVTRYGIDYNSLMVFCLVWGMGGAFISLALSRVMAKAMMGVRLIPDNAGGQEGQLVRTVHRLAQSAGLPAMPEVGIYQSPELNAFATGPTRSRALVAVSSGLLQGMQASELEGVLGHEISHVANGDMVTMTLLQGVVNAFTMFLSRAIAFAVGQAMRSNDDRDSGRNTSPMLVYAIQMALEVAFMILGSMVVAWFSRYREYRADAGGAHLAGASSMVRALQRLQGSTLIDETPGQGTVQTLKIAGHPRGLMALFASHPPLDERIKRLQAAA